VYRSTMPHFATMINGTRRQLTLAVLSIRANALTCLHAAISIVWEASFSLFFHRRQSFATRI